MPKCIDCGEEYVEGERYCSSCGSPTQIKMPTDAELRRAHIDTVSTGSNKRMQWFIIAIILFVSLIVAVLYISRMISTQLDKIGSGFY